VNEEALTIYGYICKENEDKLNETIFLKLETGLKTKEKKRMRYYYYLKSHTNMRTRDDKDYSCGLRNNIFWMDQLVEACESIGTKNMQT